MRKVWRYRYSAMLKPCKLETCKQLFEATGNNKYCSDDCREKAGIEQTKRWREQNPDYNGNYYRTNKVSEKEYEVPVIKGRKYKCKKCGKWSYNRLLCDVCFKRAGAIDWEVI